MTHDPRFPTFESIVNMEWDDRTPDHDVSGGISRPFLGDEDADCEWDASEVPVDVFLHTNSYREFLGEHVTCLFGRRGTGKSSILRMLHHEIRNAENNLFGHCWIVNDESAYKDLSIQLRGSKLVDFPEVELRHILKKIWRWVIKVSAMQAVTYGLDSDASRDPDLKRVSDYLYEVGLAERNTASYSVRRETGVKFIARLINEELETSAGKFEIGVVINRVTERLNSEEMRAAENALTRVLTKRDEKCLVLIDSIDEYNLRDTLGRGNIAGLLEAINRTYQKRGERNVFAKVAFPSEVYPHLTIWNSGKVASKYLFILWKYRDLVSFVAKRYYWAIVSNANELVEHETISALDDYAIAKKFLCEHLPEKVRTRNGFEFDSIAYILKHTQKRPRQLLIAVNKILTVASERSGNIEQIDEGSIQAGVHSVSRSLFDDALANYEEIYREARRLTEHAFARRKNIFPASELDVYVRDVSNLRGSTDLSVDEVKRLFVEAGVIGRVARSSKHSKDKLILDVEYEYQLKGSINVGKDDWIVIHPMFYDAFGISVSKHVMTNPIAEPYERLGLASGNILIR